MRRRTRAWLCGAAAAALLGGCAAPSPLAETGDNVNQMLLGRWMPSEPTPGCAHYIDFGAASTVTVVSGAARLEGTYRLTTRPSPLGLYRMQVTLVRDTPGRDCQGQGADAAPGAPGETFELGYIWIDPAKDIFVLCEEDSYQYCGVPMRRVR